jgi:hypothetical protein
MNRMIICNHARHLVGVLVVALAACSSQPGLGPLPDAGQPPGADFSGSWELDLAQSDNIQRELDSIFRELRRQAERRAQTRGDGRSGPGYSLGVDGNAMVDLARMAEYVTRSPLLEVEQSDAGIRVKREENFALDCAFGAAEPETEKNPLGREICGWDDHQLVFWVLLPEGVKINHRFSLGPRGERLNIATSVYSDRSSYPFTINRVYHRFDPEADGISCEVTLTRGRVCTTEQQ